MSKVICVTNQKGGVGKTTTVYALGLGYKEKGYKVLAVDLDPQGNLSFCIGAETESSATVYDVIKGECKAKDAIQKTEIIDILPANILLSGADLEFVNTGREFLLKEAMEEQEREYDYIFIDTPPALNLMTINAFTLSDIIIVPMLADIFSLQGLVQLSDTVKRVRKYCNPKVKIEGILLTKYNGRSLLSREIMGTAQMVAKELETDVFDTFIRTGIAVSEAQAVQENLYAYASKSNVAADYMAFTEELMKRGI